VTGKRAHNVRLRRKLQKKGTKSAKRLLRRRRRKEQRSENPPALAVGSVKFTAKQNIRWEPGAVYDAVLVRSAIGPLLVLTDPRPPVRKEEDDDEERADLEQSGGEGFTSFFPDKGKAGFLGLKKLTASLQHDFFQSKSYTLAAKQQFITDLINWLETQRKNLRS
jgi:hypothetical protein